MDRRHFFQTLLSAPILTPLFLASRSRTSEREVYLISDTPQIHLPLLLKELFRTRETRPGTFSIQAPSPYTDKLYKTFSLNGWQFDPNSSGADLDISFRTLHHPSRPSFTLVKDGQVWDVRSWKLHSLWQEMSQHHSPSSLLTVASLMRQGPDRRAGEVVTVYMNGQPRESFFLKENRRRSYATNTGRITVQIADGSVRITESTCRQKICISSQPISLSGERIICAPEHFLLEVGGGAIDTVIG
ncbi:MAG: NusG domain II-containing protein [Candidatus Aminicenantes bacterium]|jgi:hypothetical protein